MKRFKLFGWYLIKDCDLYRLQDKKYSDGFTNGYAEGTMRGKPLAGITFTKQPAVFTEVEEILRELDF